MDDSDDRSNGPRHARRGTPVEGSRSGRRWAGVVHVIRRRNVRPWFLAASVALFGLIGWLDVATGPGREPAALYDVPILLAAVAYGAAGAIAMACASTIAYIGTLVWLAEPFTIADLSQAIIFLALGVALGLLVREYLAAHALQRRLERANAELEARVDEAVQAERAAQRQVEDSRRLTMMGEAAAQIAHEIKNPLVTIGGFARQVGHRVSDDADAKEKIEIIVEEVRRLETLLRDLLEFSRPALVEGRPIEIDALAEAAVAVARPGASERGVRLKLDAKGPCPRVVGDPNQLKSALLNLLLNGIDAMPSGGDLAVEIERIDGGEAGAARITVRDTGTGIAPENLPRVFEPFFTTRSRGTGLGLPLVKKTIEAHGGSIEIASECGAGTTIRIVLPLATRAPAGGAAA